jgi:hypothetical protein
MQAACEIQENRVGQKMGVLWQREPKGQLGSHHQPTVQIPPFNLYTSREQSIYREREEAAKKNLDKWRTNHPSLDISSI